MAKNTSAPTHIEETIDTLMRQLRRKLTDDRRIQQFLAEFGIDPETCEITIQADEVKPGMIIEIRKFEKGGDLSGS